MLSEWSRWARLERGLASSTIARYERDLLALQDQWWPRGLETLALGHLRTFVESREGSPATIGGRVAALRSFYGWLTRSDQRPDDPSLRLDRPAVHRGLPRPVKDADAVAAAFFGIHSQTYAIAVFLLETGLRISEACAVFVRPPAPLELTVLGKGSKERMIPLTARARDALDSLGGAIPISARSVQRRFAKAGFSPHRLRHTLATELARADVDLSVIQDILGHASSQTTRVYLQNQTARLREGLERRGK